MTDLQQQLHTLAERMATDQAARSAEITTLVQRIEQLETAQRKAEQWADHSISVLNSQVSDIAIKLNHRG